MFFRQHPDTNDWCVFVEIMSQILELHKDWSNRMLALEEEHVVDVLAMIGDERRDSLR